MRLARYWPGYVLLLFAVVGGIAYGFGGAVSAPVVGMLVVGPGYLIQQRLRRRRGASPSGRRLGREADDVFGVFVQRYLASKRAHPIRWEVIEVVYGAAMVTAIWLVLGGTVGFVFAVLWGVLMLLGLVIVVARLRFRPPGQT